MTKQQEFRKQTEEAKFEAFSLMCKKVAELEKENDRLKGDLELWESGGCRATNLFECGVVKELEDQLTKAKNLIKNIIRVTWGEGWNYSLDWKVKAEQFLKEIEKCGSI